MNCRWTRCERSVQRQDMGPLVSIMIPNFNHSRFLDECIQSAVNQTYENLEIVVLDNASTDNSVEVAAKYMTDARVSVCRNQFNIVNNNYRVLSDILTHGKYMMLLCADDYIHPEFVARAVDIMEKHPNVGYVHGERDFVLENGEVQELDPFYKCSFTAPGKNAMPIYMVTTVAHPSQGIFRRESFEAIHGYDKEIDHMNGDKTLWFYLSYVCDMAYIRDKMCGIRLGAQTETFIAQRKFQHPLLCHLTIKDFVKFAREKDIPAVYQREEEAMARLAREFVGYAIGMLSVGDYALAEAYLIYAEVVSREICEEDAYRDVKAMIAARNADMDALKKYVVSQSAKKRGYEPPAGYVEL